MKNDLGKWLALKFFELKIEKKRLLLERLIGKKKKTEFSSQSRLTSDQPSFNIISFYSVKACVK